MQISKPNPMLLHEIYLMATSMPARLSFEAMFQNSSDEDLHAVMSRLEAVQPPGHHQPRMREVPGERPERKIMADIEAFGVRDVANLADTVLSKQVERLAPGLLLDEGGEISVKVDRLQVDGAAGDQQVLAAIRLRLGYETGVLSAMVRGTWNGKEVGYKSMTAL